MIPIAANQTKHPSILAVLTLLAVLAVLVFVALSYPAIVDSRDAAQGVREQAAATACRAQYRADIDDASAAVAASSAQLDLLTNQALEAVLLGDVNALAALQESVHSARQTLAGSLVTLADANHRYREAIDACSVT